MIVTKITIAFSLIMVLVFSVLSVLVFFTTNRQKLDGIYIILIAIIFALFAIINLMIL